jgi:hypothetical protein
MIQLKLQFSKTGNLTLVRPTGTVLESVNDGPEPPAEPYILGLPDELLNNIFSLAMGRCGGYGSIYYSCGASIASTCKQFQGMAQRLLYRSILFQNCCGLVPACRPARRFHATLKSNPLLGTFCRTLDIYVSTSEWMSSTGKVRETVADDYNLANELLSWLPNVRHFTIHGGFNRGNSNLTWEMLRIAFEHMPFIKDITILTQGLHGLLVDDIVNNVNLPHLETLSIHGASEFSVSSGGEGQNVTYTVAECWRDQVSFHEILVPLSCLPQVNLSLSGLDLGLLLLPSSMNRQAQGDEDADAKLQDKENTANFKTLNTDSCSASPAALSKLLAWPKLLENFSFGRNDSILYQTGWDLSIFQSLLSPYQASLKTLSIGGLDYVKERSLIDLSSFLSLEEFWVSKYSFAASPKEAASVFLAPKLRKFTWDFGIRDQHSESWSDFGIEEEKWILDFAELASSRGSALREFWIQFQPDRYSAPYTRQAYKAVGYPWDRMDAMKGPMSARGITLEYYPSPIFSKADMEQRLDQMERDQEYDPADSEHSPVSTET